MKYAAYDQYKPSGIEWLGNVPLHWIVARSDGIVSSERRQVQPEAFLSEDVFHYSIPLVQEYGTGAVEEGESIKSAKQPVCRKSLLVSKLNPRKATIVVAEPQPNLRTVCSTEFVTLFANKCDLRFLTYVTLSEAFRQRLDAAVQSVTRSHQRANPQDIYSFWNAWPPLEEQQIIARFLDAKTAQIDALVAQKRQLIDKLKEKRQALIARTVTRGLPPEAAEAAGLEPNSELKDSGVEWLGEIPRHWDIEKFAREVHIAEGQVDPEREPFASMFLIAPNHVESGTGRLLALETAAEQFAESGKYLCPEGAVIYSKIRPALRKAVIAPERCLCSADMYPLTCKKRLTNPYLYWLLLSDQFSAWSVLEADRVAMPKINRETLKELRLPIPPKNEQLKIVDYLTAETAKVDHMLSKVDAVISSLTEYRQALITSAVTGKIDVRGLA